MGRCPKGCKGSLSIPLDQALGLSAHQQSSEELIRLGCLLSIMMLYELASWMLGQWSGLTVSATTLWHWVQQKQGGFIREKKNEDGLSCFKINSPCPS